jgi:dolichol-phosphate mannosyltransferase
MDGDLQHPPELIPTLLEKWQEGYDVVLTLRQSTADTGLLKKVSSRLFYGVVNSMSEVRIPPGAADFRLLDRKVVEVLKSLGERAVFHRGLVSWVGHRQAAVSYEAHARHGGKSKYSLSRMLRFAVSGVTSFSSVPLYIAAFAGVIISGFSFAYAAFAVYARLFTDRVVQGWTSVLVAVLFLGGVQLIALGVHGAYLGRIYGEVKGRPRYLVRQAYGFEE